MQKLLRFIVCLAPIISSICTASPRIGVLQSFSDIESRDYSRSWLAEFDAKLQAELLTRWECEVLSRSGLSAVVFEQKLASAKDPEVPPPLVLPADVSVITVLDTHHKQLRMHVTCVSDDMSLSDPKVFPYNSINQLSENLPSHAAEYLAEVAKLKELKKSDHAVKKASGLTCALIDPIFSENKKKTLNGLASLYRASIEQEISSLEQSVELVERDRITALLEEAELTTNSIVGTNASASLGRLVGADLILLPFVHVVSENLLNTTLFAVDTKSGKILAARTWSGSTLDSPPAKTLQELLDQAMSAFSYSSQQIIDIAAKRHAEANFIIKLRKSFGGLRQRVGTQAELALNLADASLALAHDNTDIMRNAVTELGSMAIPAVLTTLQKELYPNDKYNAAIIELMESGRLAELHEQAKRIFGLAYKDLEETDEDIYRIALYHISLGEADKACKLLESKAPDLDSLAANDSLYEVYLRALLAAGYYEECTKFIVKRRRWSVSANSIYLDALHATGNHKEEFRIIWVNRKKWMITASVDQLARFLLLAVDHGESAQALVSFSRYSNAWRRNSVILRVPLVKLRIAAGQKERAISDAQCMWLASRAEGEQRVMEELEGLLTTMGAEPLQKLPSPSDTFKFTPGTHIDLIHDKTLTLEFVSKVAHQIADFWGCEVHIYSCELDATKLSSFDRLNKSIEGREFARGICHFAEQPENLLQTIFLTDHKLRSTENNYVGSIYGCPSLGSSVNLISTYYFRIMKAHDLRPLEYSTAIAAANLPVVAGKFRNYQLEYDPQGEYFFTFNPDLLSNNSNLHMKNLVLGMAPSTKRLLMNFKPSDFLNQAELFRKKDLKEERENPAPDADYFRKISPILAGSKPIIILSKSQK